MTIYVRGGSFWYVSDALERCRTPTGYRRTWIEQLPLRNIVSRHPSVNLLRLYYIPSDGEDKIVLAGLHHFSILLLSYDSLHFVLLHIFAVLPIFHLRFVLTYPVVVSGLSMSSNRSDCLEKVDDVRSNEAKLVFNFPFYLPEW